MKQPVLKLKILGNASKQLVYEILNAVNRSKGNRVRQMDFNCVSGTQSGILNIELHEPERVLIRRISAVAGVMKVSALSA